MPSWPCICWELRSPSLSLVVHLGEPTARFCARHPSWQLRFLLWLVALGRNPSTSLTHCGLAAVNYGNSASEGPNLQYYHPHGKDPS